MQSRRFFHFYILKKQNFKKYMSNREIFKNGCHPSSWQHDLNVKKLHLGPGAQGALNSELVKSI